MDKFQIKGKEYHKMNLSRLFLRVSTQNKSKEIKKYHRNQFFQ